MEITGFEMAKAKEFFDKVQKLGEGTINGISVIDTTQDFSEITSYRVYHKDGYCMEVSRELIDLSEDEDCEMIDGYYYSFGDDLFDGFKEVDNIDEAIKLIEIK